MNDGTTQAATTSGHEPSPPAAPAGQGRRTWPVLAVAVLVVVAAIGLVVRHAVSSPAAGPPAVHASLPSRTASYLGVYEPQAPSAYQQVAGFSQAAGQQPNVAG